MTYSDEAFYQQDAVRAMSTVTHYLAETIGAKTDAHTQARLGAEAIIADLKAAGVAPPVDLPEATNRYVNEIRAGYIATKDTAEERLGLPVAVQEALGIIPAMEQQRIDTARQWIKAIDSAWTFGGS